MHTHAHTHMTFECAPAPRSSTINRSSLVSRRAANLALDRGPKHTHIYMYTDNISPSAADEWAHARTCV